LDLAIARQSGSRTVTTRRRWIVPVAAVVIAIVPVVVAAIRVLVHGWIPIGDNGLILLRAHDVGTANHPLLGTWTSASQAAGQNLNNPGPLWFDWLSPFVRLGGPSVGMAVAVMLANITAIAGAAWAAYRIGGQRALVLVTALSAGLAWSMGSELLFDAWQPHAMLLPFWTLLVMCWALAAGDLVTAPFVVGIASLLIQTHLSFVYVVAFIGAATLVLLGAGLRRVAKVGGAAWARQRSTFREVGIWTVVVAVVAWSQPLIDQLFGDGNLGHLLTSSGDDNDRVGLGLGTRFVASVVALPPWWTRSGFSSIIRATGVVDDPRGRTVAEGHVAGPLAAVLGLLVVFAVLGGVVFVGWRRRSRPVVVLGALAAAAVGAALVSMVLMPIGLIGISPHQMRWLWPISALALLAPAVAIAEWPPAQPAVVPLGLVVTAAISVANLPTYAAPEGPTADRAYTATAMRLVDQLSSYRPAGRVLFDIRGLRFAEPYSGPVLAELARRGVDVVVDDDGMVRQLGERRRAHGDEPDRLIILEGDATTAPPAGARPVALVPGLTPAEADELDRLRAEVLAIAARNGLQLDDAGRRALRAGRIDVGDVVLPPGDDPAGLEASGVLAALVADGYVALDPSTEDTFRRYAELQQRKDRQTVGVFEVPTAAP
jgi:hypothetical protein